MSPANGRLLPRTAAGPTGPRPGTAPGTDMRTSVLYRSACAITPSRHAVLAISARPAVVPAVDLAAVPGAEHKDR